jgi:hypothetical protein
MYLEQPFFELVQRAKLTHEALRVLVLTPDVDKFKQAMKKHLPIEHQNIFYIFSVPHKSVPFYLASADILASFIKPSFARIACSPTKISEALAQGIPIISNCRIGDLEQWFDSLDAGVLVDFSSSREIEETSKILYKIRAKGGQRLRDLAQTKVSLDIANQQYAKIYQRLKLKC